MTSLDPLYAQNAPKWGPKLSKMTTLDPPGTMTRTLAPFLHVFIALWCPKWSPKCFQNRPFFDIFSGSFFDHFLVPKWCQNGSQNRSKIYPKPNFLTPCFSTLFWSAFKIQKLVHCRFFVQSDPVKSFKSYGFYSMNSLWLFFWKIVPRSFSDRFLLQNGSQKAPQNGPKWTLEASFLSVVFPPTF